MNNITYKIRFELTEWAEDGNTRLRHVDLESTSFTDLYTRFNASGSYTAAEQAAVGKLIDAMKELHDGKR